AWSSQHFGAAVDLLARLDQLDPGGRLSNRPFASLCGIFCPWHPENSASVDRQLEVIDGLRDRFPQCAWRLMIAWLPSMHRTHFPTNEPEFRGWKPERVSVTQGEYLSLIKALVSRLLSDAGIDGGRWRDLAKEMTNLPPLDRTAVVDRLREASGELA